MVLVITYITACCRPAKSCPPSTFWYYELRIVFLFINSHSDINRIFHDLWKFSEIRLVPLRRSFPRAYACPLVCLRIAPLSRRADEAGSCDRWDTVAHKSFKYLFSRKTANPWPRLLEEEFLVAKQGGYWSAACDVIPSHTNNSLHPSEVSGAAVMLGCVKGWRWASWGSLQRLSEIVVRHELLGGAPKFFSKWFCAERTVKKYLWRSGWVSTIIKWLEFNKIILGFPLRCLNPQCFSWRESEGDKWGQTAGGFSLRTGDGSCAS